jgi:glycosyltransferase involved in cell wall biosynthesis
MSRSLRIAQVAPVATSVPPPRSGSIESMTSLLTEGLVARGHEVTLFATGESQTTARLHATFAHGYRQEPSMWPWELCELINIAAAMERASEFDLIHCQAEYQPLSMVFSRLSPTPLLQTLHYSPGPDELAMWERYRDAAFVAVSAAQARLMGRLNVVAVVPHGLDTSAFTFRADPDDYLLFLGRFTPGKGPLEAIEIAARAGQRLVLAAEANEYYRTAVAPHVDGVRVTYAGELDHAGKVALLGGARALLYPVQVDEPYGLVLAEAASCGTPVAALDRGAAREVVVDGATGFVFQSVDELIERLPQVLALDRKGVRAAAEEQYGVDGMVDGYLAAYAQLLAASKRGVPVGDR